MPDYRRMYYTLCAGMSALLDDMQPDGENEPVYRRLEMLLQEAEDIYIETSDVIQLPERSCAGTRRRDGEGRHPPAL